MGLIFEKSPIEFTEQELQERINQVDPKYGAILSYELIRRLTVENSKSSKRFAGWSLGIAILAIIISIVLGISQMFKIQNVQVINEPLYTETINAVN